MEMVGGVWDQNWKCLFDPKTIQTNQMFKSEISTGGFGKTVLTIADNTNKHY